MHRSCMSMFILSIIVFRSVNLCLMRLELQLFDTILCLFFLSFSCFQLWLYSLCIGSQILPTKLLQLLLNITHIKSIKCLKKHANNQTTIYTWTSYFAFYSLSFVILPIVNCILFLTCCYTDKDNLHKKNNKTETQFTYIWNRFTNTKKVKVILFFFSIVILAI